MHQMIATHDGDGGVLVNVYEYEGDGKPADVPHEVYQLSLTDAAKLRERLGELLSTSRAATSRPASAMTFEEFKASGRYLEDLSTATVYPAVPGRLYAGVLVIEDSLSAPEGLWALRIGDTSRWSDDLESLERELFEHGLSEGILLGSADPSPTTIIIGGNAYRLVDGAIFDAPVKADGTIDQETGFGEVDEREMEPATLAAVRKALGI
jgi:hypothetical protein